MQPMKHAPAAAAICLTRQASIVWRMNTAAHSSFAPSAAPRVASKARRGAITAWSAPYRSESFAEDLPEWRAPAPAAKPRWRVALLLAVPLGVALIGGLLPIVAAAARADSC
jgi:hypothetical protein